VRIRNGRVLSCDTGVRLHFKLIDLLRKSTSPVAPNDWNKYTFACSSSIDVELQSLSRKHVHLPYADCSLPPAWRPLLSATMGQWSSARSAAIATLRRHCHALAVSAPCWGWWALHGAPMSAVSNRLRVYTCCMFGNSPRVCVLRWMLAVARRVANARSGKRTRQQRKQLALVRDLVYGFQIRLSVPAIESAAACVDRPRPLRDRPVHYWEDVAT